MEAKLIKTEEGLYQIELFNDKDLWACAKGLLSLKNCQAIENGYDLDELAYSHLVNINDSTISTSWQGYTEDIFKAGFQKALEILGDKKFSEEDVRTVFYVAIQLGMNQNIAIDKNKPLQDEEIVFNKVIQSLQQTEWDVEVEMEDKIAIDGHTKIGIEPKLDSEGCLILKRV